MECQASCPSALLRLCSSLHGLSGAQLQQRVNKYLEEWTEATVSFIIPMERQETDSLYIEVIGENIQRPTTPVPAEKVLRQQLDECRTVQFNELDRDRLNDIEGLLECQVQSFISIPICQPPQEPAPSTPGSPEAAHPTNNGPLPERPESRKAVLLVCLANRRGGGQFTETDVKIVRECLQVCIGVLLSTFAYEEELRLKTQCQKLLTVARNLFTHLDDVSVLLRQIMSEARQLTSAERCSLFLVDRKEKELIAKVFDGQVLPDGTVQPGPEVRLPLGRGIAGHVATTGALVNIKDAYHHPHFYSGVDEITGFKTKNILCFPICDDGGVIGVAELCNKLNNNHFTKFDEEMAMAFSAYCGVAILHSLMYKKVADAQYRSKLSNELMMYHMKVSDTDVSSLVQGELLAPASIHPSFTDFSFTPRLLPSQDSAKVVYSMFHNLGMVARWRISPECLGRFILMVRRGYRDPPYHNWQHAYSVAHFCFCLLHNLKLMETGVLTEMEGLTLLISCLCHDVDHRGTNSQFQISSNSVLAALYSSEGSVMERHHFAQAMCILNTEGCNILENLSEKEYTECLDLIRDNILATDMADHLRIVPEMEAMISDGYNSGNKRHRRLLMSLLMTSCDLSNQTKNWKTSKKIAELIYTEFFSQGDLEKAMGNKPVESMDREKAFIPKLQLDFINNIALPVFRMLSQVLPSGREPYQAVLRNKECWEVASNILAKRCRTGSGDVLDFFKEEEFDTEVLNIQLKKQLDQAEEIS